MSLVNIPITIPIDATPSDAQPVGSVGAPMTLSVKGSENDSFVIDIAGSALAFDSVGWTQMCVVNIGPSGSLVLSASNWNFAYAQLSYWRIRRTVGTAAMVVNLSGPPNTISAGPSGPPGSPGADGAPGVSAFTTVAQGDSWAWPNIGETQFLLLTDGSWIGVGQYLWVSDGTNYGTLQLVQKLGGFFELYNPGWDGPAGGTAVADGATVSPGGRGGTAGAAAYTVFMDSFVQPAINATVNTRVTSSAAFNGGQYVYGVGGGIYLVTATPDSTHITLKNLGVDPENVAPGVTVPAFGLLVSSGKPTALWRTTVTLSFGQVTLTDARFTTSAAVQLTQVQGTNQGALYYTRPGGSIVVKSTQGISDSPVIVEVLSW